jgi:hypothetical protein
MVPVNRLWAAEGSVKMWMSWETPASSLRKAIVNAVFAGAARQVLR